MQINVDMPKVLLDAIANVDEKYAKKITISGKEKFDITTCFDDNNGVVTFDLK